MSDSGATDLVTRIHDIQAKVKTLTGQELLHFCQQKSTWDQLQLTTLRVALAGRERRGRPVAHLEAGVKNLSTLKSELDKRIGLI
jgi:hypothetical protein